MKSLPIIDMEWDNDCESRWSDVYEGVQKMSHSLSMAIIESFCGWFNIKFQWFLFYWVFIIMDQYFSSIIKENKIYFKNKFNSEIYLNDRKTYQINFIISFKGQKIKNSINHRKWMKFLKNLHFGNNKSMACWGIPSIVGVFVWFTTFMPGDEFKGLL